MKRLSWGGFDFWDLLILAGIELICWGLAQIYTPAGYISAGIAMVLLGVKVGK